MEENEIENNQKKSSWGGKREGSGRKLGISEITKNKKLFHEYITDEKREELVFLALEQAQTKPEMLKFVLEQLFGKAPQGIDFQGQGHFIIEIAKQIADKHENYDTNSNTSPDSN